MIGARRSYTIAMVSLADVSWTSTGKLGERIQNLRNLVSIRKLNLFLKAGARLSRMTSSKSQKWTLPFVLRGGGRIATLRNASTGEVTHSQIDAVYESLTGTYDLLSFESEEAVAKYLSVASAPLVLQNRVRVPRLLYDGFAWPMDDSEERRAFEGLAKYEREYRSGTRQFKPTPVEDLNDLLKYPSHSYLEWLRTHLGSEWPWQLWASFADAPGV